MFTICPVQVTKVAKICDISKLHSKLPCLKPVVRIAKVNAQYTWDTTSWTLHASDVALRAALLYPYPNVFVKISQRRATVKQFPALAC